MAHICFEVQLCIKISIFKEKDVFDILIILPSLGSLVIELRWQLFTEQRLR